MNSFIALFSLISFIPVCLSINIDAFFCIARQQYTDDNKVCMMFFEDVRTSCELYILSNPTIVQNCYTSNLRGNIDHDVSRFLSFIQQERKEYYELDEFINRYYIFKDNIDYINKENMMNHSYLLGTNKFADLTNAEYIDTYLSNTFVKKSYCIIKTLNDTLSTSVDWVTLGAVTPIKNQQNCGSCWAFSTVSALESLHKIQTGNLVEFSEQQLVSCSQKYMNMGCNGGLMQNAFSYVVDNGITTEQSYPYTSGTTEKSGTCKSFTSVYKIKGCYNVGSNEYQLTQHIAKQPVSVSIDAGSRNFQLYSSGIFDAPCGSGQNGEIVLNHGVVAVGYGTSNGKNYYRVRNSWGNWGDNGYIYLLRNFNSTVGTCGIAEDASVPY